MSHPSPNGIATWGRLKLSTMHDTSHDDLASCNAHLRSLVCSCSHVTARRCMHTAEHAQSAVLYRSCDSVSTVAFAGSLRVTGDRPC